MTFAARVLDQVDIPGSDADLFPSRYFQLCLAAKRNHVLAAWSGVPILDRAGLSAMQLRSGNAHQFRHLVWVAYREFSFDFFSVRLAIRPRVEPHHHDRLVLLNPTHFSPSLCA